MAFYDPFVDAVEGGWKWTKTAAKDIYNAGKDAFTDTFSAQDAKVDPVKPEDYYFGGSEAKRDQTIRDLTEQGGYNRDQLMTTGDQAWSGMNTAQLGIKGAAFSARDSGIANADAASGLSYLARQGFNNAPDSYGNEVTQDNWQSAISKLGSYQPSTQTAASTNRLANYDGGNVDSRLGDAYDRLNAYATQGPGPSAAEAQLRSAQDQNVANQIALARSGRGAGANANAARQAAFQSADIGQRTAADMATLRANEAAAWRQQQLQALSGAGNLAGTLESAQQGRQGMELTGLTSGASLYGNQDQLRLAASQGAASQYGNMYGAEAGATQAAANTKQGYLTQATTAQSNAAAQDAGAFDDFLGGLGSAANLTAQAGLTRLDAMKSGIASQSAYDQSALGIQENEATRRAGLAGAYMHEQAAASRANQAADLEKDASQAGLISTGFGAITGGLGG